MDIIENKDLKFEDIPNPNDDWYLIAKFALTFPGYQYWGSFDKCAKIANDSVLKYKATKELSDDLTALRTCLFFEQRRYRHFGYKPDEKAMQYVKEILKKIRSILRNYKENTYG